jgi:hypothetical protein
MEQRVTDDQRARQNGRNRASNLLAAAAAIFAVLAVILYLRPGGGGGIAPIPTAAPGSNQIINVTEALKAQGLTVEQPRGLFIPAGTLAAPGQGVEINGHPGFIFLFADADAAQAAVTSVNPNDVVPERLAGTPTPAGERRMAHGSNVIVLLIGGDAQTWQKVENAVASLS